jgi:hypothetical protein
MLSFHPTVVQNLRGEHNQVFGSDLDTTKKNPPADPTQTQ